MKNNVHQNYTRWSIRRLSVGVASVVVASGFFILTSPVQSVLANEVATPVSQTTPDKVNKEKESKLNDVNKLIKNAADTALTNPNDSSTSPQPTESTTNKPVENKVEDRAATSTAETRTNSETPAAPVAENPTTAVETKPEQVKAAVKDNVKDNIDVPAAYLEKAEGKGPFTAGVNQVIPYEFFAGDGMLTRLLLKASDKAPWSDNGTAKNPALSPLGENVNTKGQYFYEVDLKGNTDGKQGQALIDQLRANGTQTYKAIVKVYGNKDGKADLSNVVATREVRITLHKENMATNQSSSTTNTTSTMKEEHARKDEMKPTTMEHSQQMNSKTMEQEKAKKEELSTPMMKQQKEEAKEMKNNDSMKKESKATLPETGETSTNTSALGVFSAGLAFVLGILGLKAKKERI